MRVTFQLQGGVRNDLTALINYKQMKTYTTEEIYEKAKEIIPKHKLIFVEDVCAYMGISKPTFYKYIDVNSDEFNELKKMLEKNCIDIKVGLRKKWFDSDNATLQMALYKLTSTDVEHRKLNQNYTDVTTKDQEIKTTTIVFGKFDNDDDDDDE